MPETNPPAAPHCGRDDASACGVAIVVVSDTRTLETDTSGAWAAEQLEAAGHRLVSRRVVPDEPGAIRETVAAAIAEPAIDVVLVTGGSGTAPRDVTPEAVAPLLERELPAFGVLFAQRSFATIGSRALLSRAVAGLAGRTAIFVMPGSRGAVELALIELILPELGHLLAHLRL